MSTYSQSVPAYLFGSTPRSNGGGGGGGTGRSGATYAAPPSANVAGNHISNSDGGGGVKFSSRAQQQQHQNGSAAKSSPTTTQPPPLPSPNIIDLLTAQPPKQQQHGGGGAKRFQKQPNNNNNGGAASSKEQHARSDRSNPPGGGGGAASDSVAGRYTAPTEWSHAGVKPQVKPLVVELTSGGGGGRGDGDEGRRRDVGKQPKRYRLETTTTATATSSRPTTVATTTTTMPAGRSGQGGGGGAGAEATRIAAPLGVGRAQDTMSQQQQQHRPPSPVAPVGEWSGPINNLSVRVGSNIGNPFIHVVKGADGQPRGAGGQPLRCGGDGGAGARGASSSWITRDTRQGSSSAINLPNRNADGPAKNNCSSGSHVVVASTGAYITPTTPSSGAASSGAAAAGRAYQQPPVVKVGSAKSDAQRSVWTLHSTNVRSGDSGGRDPPPSRVVDTTSAPSRQQASDRGSQIDLTLAASGTQRAATAARSQVVAPSPIDTTPLRHRDSEQSSSSSGGYLGLSPQSTISEALRRVQRPLIPSSLLNASLKPNTTALPPSWASLAPPQLQHPTTSAATTSPLPAAAERRVVDTTITAEYNKNKYNSDTRNDNNKRRRSPTPPRARASGVLSRAPPGGCILVFDTSSLIKVVEKGKRLDDVVRHHRIYIPYITLDELDKKSKPTNNNNRGGNGNSGAMTATMKHCRCIRDWLTARMLEEEELQRAAASRRLYQHPGSSSNQTSSSWEPRIRIQRHSEVDPAYEPRVLSNDDGILGYAVYLRNVQQVAAPIVFVTEDKMLELKAMSERFSAISVLKLLDASTEDG